MPGFGSGDEGSEKNVIVTHDESNMDCVGVNRQPWGGNYFQIA
jgi:hypothetical protein